jgi:hypothetical protein
MSVNQSPRQIVRWLLVAVTGLGLAVEAAMAAETPSDEGTTFTKDGSTYTARHVFQSSLQTVDLLSICFDFKHLRGFYHGSEVKLLKTGPDWQTLEYRSDYKVCTSSATYNKTLDRAHNTIRFTMLNHQVSGWGMPVMIASSGSYAIDNNAKIRTITYEQRVTLTREIGAFDWAMIERKTRDFFMDFDAYIRQQETLRANRDASPKTGASP